MAVTGIGSDVAHEKCTEQHHDGKCTEHASRKVGHVPVGNALMSTSDDIATLGGNQNHQNHCHEHCGHDGNQQCNNGHHK